MRLPSEFDRFASLPGVARVTRDEHSGPLLVAFDNETFASIMPSARRLDCFEVVFFGGASQEGGHSFHDAVHADLTQEEVLELVESLARPGDPQGLQGE